MICSEKKRSAVSAKKANQFPEEQLSLFIKPAKTPVGFKKGRGAEKAAGVSPADFSVFFLDEALAATVLRLPREQLKALINKVINRWRYRTWRMAKKSGGWRKISSPNKSLKHLQRLILVSFLYRFQTSTDLAHGFVFGRSIVTNAKTHARFGARSALRVDLKDAFPSVTKKRVREIFADLFTLLGLPDFACDLFADLTTHEGSLPQGAPTSPALLNLACVGLDSDLAEWTAIQNSHHQFCVTRYADDIVVSSRRDVIPREITPDILAIIKKNGFRAARGKTIFFDYPRGYPRITGLSVVDGKVVVPPKTLHALRGIIRVYCGLKLKALAGLIDERSLRLFDLVIGGFNGFLRMVYGKKIPRKVAVPLRRALNLQKIKRSA